MEKYYEIANRKFKVEKINERHYELTMFENGEFVGTWNFEGANAWGECLDEILSYSEISDEDYNS